MREKVQSGGQQDYHDDNYSDQSFDSTQDRKPTKEKKSRPPSTNNSWLQFAKSRQGLGIISIALAATIIFVALPYMQSKVTATTTAVVFTETVFPGDMIDSSKVKEVDAATFNLPVGTVSSKDDVIGLYVTTSAITGDFVTYSRLSSIHPGDDPVLTNLAPDQLAVSISLPSMEQSLSSKLRAGDIIRLFSIGNENDITYAKSPAELQYVEVIAVSDSAGNTVSTYSETTIDTITLAVNQTQASVLIALEHTQTMHAALVSRGDAQTKQAALTAQASYFTDGIGLDGDGE